ncbi:MAG: 3-hydroxyacyl-CoA dehydrogenase NAD-binding domain-containing protein [Thiotrichales bacterium]
MTQQYGEHWQLRIDQDNLGWLGLDRSGASTNTLSTAVLHELEQFIAEIEAKAPGGLLIYSGKSSGFIAGADVNEFAEPEFLAHAFEHLRRTQQLFDRIESLAMPTCVLIDGFCLGGGLELALACDYRIATDSSASRAGLPEVKLGIHPGYGGSVRLIRLIGAVKAMDMMLRGRILPARPARRLGLIDEIVPRRHLEKAGRRFLLETPVPHRPRLLERMADWPLIRAGLAGLMRRRLREKVLPDHYPAPYALLDVWQRTGARSNGMFEAEARSVARLVENPSAQQLVRTFFLQNRLKSAGKGSGDGLLHIHVAGAGVMGGDIAAWCALQGFNVTLQDQKPALIAPAIGRAASLFRQKLHSETERMAAFDRLSADPAGDGVSRADVIIEAIVENLAIKQAVFRDLEARAGPQAILATNTSSIPLEQIAAALEQPERLLGLHFFNPVAKMPLVEVVVSAATSATTIDRASLLIKSLKKLPLPVQSAPGFLVNRVLMPYLLEAMIMIDERIPPAEIDAAATAFGMPMGPVLLADTVGLDICLSVAEILAKSFPIEIPARLREQVAMKHLGKKSGQGFYLYQQGKPVNEVIKVGQADAIITDRLIYRLLNECRACLREEIVSDADLVDAGLIFGAGFAPFRGGPMQYARDQGIEQIISRLQSLADRFGERFSPDPGWALMLSDMNEPKIKR